jgi:hypothetical protein
MPTRVPTVSSAREAEPGKPSFRPCERETVKAAVLTAAENLFGLFVAVTRCKRYLKISCRHRCRTIDVLRISIFKRAAFSICPNNSGARVDE